MAEVELELEVEVKEKQLLLDTLNRLWSHYLQASDCETDDNQAASVKVCVKLGYRPRKRKLISVLLLLSPSGTLALVAAI